MADNDFIRRIEQATGARVSSGYRPESEQEALYRAGKTKARGPNAPHVRGTPEKPSSVDIADFSGDEKALRERLIQAGHTPTYIRYETGKGRNQGTGRHFHVEFDGPVRGSSGGGNAASSGTPVQRAPAFSLAATPFSGRNQMATPAEQRARELLSGQIRNELDATAEEEAIGLGIDPAGVPSIGGEDAPPEQNPADWARTTPDMPVVDVFAVAPEMRNRANKVESELAAQAAFIGKQTQTVDELQATRRARIEQNVITKRGVLDEVTTGNRQLLAQVNPLLKREAALNNRIGELATMNPLERGIRGIFDLNYNADYLEKRRNEIIGVIQDAGNQYQYTTTLQEQFMKQLDAANQNEGDLELLTMTELDEDSKLLAQSMSSAMASFAFLKDQVDTNDSVIRAQMLARTQYLDSLNPGQINSLLEQAKKSPDKQIMVDGIRVGSGELQQRSVAWEQLSLGLEGARNAVESGKLELAEKQARFTVSRMSESQLQEAAANGGVYQGVRLPADAITEGLANFQARRNLIAGQFVQQGGGAMVRDELSNQLQFIRQTHDRIRSMSGITNDYKDSQGRLPLSLSQQTNPIVNRIKMLSQQAAEAQRQGIGDTVAPQILEQIKQLRTQYDTIINKHANQLAAGNERGAKLMGAFLRGEPMNSEEATKAMMEYVNAGGLPTSMRASPTFQIMYQNVQKAVTEVDRSITNSGKRPSAVERERLIRQRIREIAPAAASAANMEQMFPQLTELAKMDKHPFGGVSRDEFLRAQQAGNTQAYQEIGAKLGVDAKMAQQIFSGGWQKPAGMEDGQAQKLLKAAQALRGELLATQRAGFLRALDDGHKGQPGFSPAAAFVDYVSTPAFYRRAGQFESMQSGFSFGDALASSMGGGNLVNMAQQYGNSMRSIYQAQQIEAVTATRDMRSRYNTLPQVRTATILGAIDELPQSDEQLLLAQIARNVKGFDDTRPFGTASTVNNSIRDFIMGSKFQDPNLERVRKVAAANWDAQAKKMDRAIDRATLSRSGEGTSPLNPFGWIGPVAANLIYGKEEN